MWRTLLTEHEVTNMIIFSALLRAVHGLPSMDTKSTEPVSSVTLAVSEEFTCSKSNLEILSATSVLCVL